MLVPSTRSDVSCRSGNGCTSHNQQMHRGMAGLCLLTKHIHLTVLPQAPATKHMLSQETRNGRHIQVVVTSGQAALAMLEDSLPQQVRPASASDPHHSYGLSSDSNGVIKVGGVLITIAPGRFTLPVQTSQFVCRSLFRSRPGHQPANFWTTGSLMWQSSWCVPLC